MKKFGILLLIVVVVLIAIGLKNNGGKFNTKKISSPESKDEIIPSVTIRTVNITKSGFNPQTLTINQGETVKWINISGTEVSVNSDTYPKNEKHPFLNLGEIPAGYSSDALFEDSGTYNYHNQKIPTQQGTIVVK